MIPSRGCLNEVFLFENTRSEVWGDLVDLAKSLLLGRRLHAWTRYTSQGKFGRPVMGARKGTPKKRELWRAP